MAQQLFNFNIIILYYGYVKKQNVVTPDTDAFIITIEQKNVKKEKANTTQTIIHSINNCQKRGILFLKIVVPKFNLILFLYTCNTPSGAQLQLLI